MLRDEPDERRIVARAWPLLRRHRALMIVATIVSLLSSGATVLTTAVIGRAADAAFDGRRSDLVDWIVVLAVLAVVDAVTIYLSKVLLVRAGERVVRTLRDTAVERLGAAPLRFLESHRSGEILRRVTGEVTELSRFVANDLPRLVGVVTTVAFTVVMLTIYSPILTLIVVVLFLPGAVAVMRWFSRDAAIAFGRAASTEAHMSATYTEAVAAGEELRLGGGASTWLRRFGVESDIVVAAERRSIAVENRIAGVALVNGAALAALLVVATVALQRGNITVGVLVVFVLASRNLFSSFDDLAESVGDLRAAKTGFARILDLVDATAPVRPMLADSILPARGTLHAAGVSFGYGDGDACIEHFDLTLEAGSRIAVVGETGSGKTTLGKLLAGLYRPESGSVRYCGIDVADLDPALLRSRVVLVPQEVHLVDGTVAENIAMVPVTVTRSQIGSAATALGLDDWVATLADGLDTRVRGTGLSAGERQIVALIRVALANPAVLILDEATADIDPATADRVERALGELSRDRTVIAIAHRPSSIEKYDRVVRLGAAPH